MNDSRKLADHFGKLDIPSMNAAKILAEATRPSQDIARILAEATRPSQDIARILAEATRPSQDIARILAEAMRPSRDISRILAEAMKPSRDVAQMMAEATQSLSSANLTQVFADFQKIPVGIADLLKELELREAPDPKGATVRIEGNATMSVSASGEGRILGQGKSGLDLSKFPTWTILFLIFLWQALAQWEDVRAAIVDINARTPPSESLSGIREFIRQELAGKPGDVRLVTGGKVKLREKPSMKSDILLELPKFSPVVVLGKEDRTWLFVSYEHDGYWIDGYVSTKFLKKVRK